MELKELKKKVEESIEKTENIGRALLLSVKGSRDKRITEADRNPFFLG